MFLVPVWCAQLGHKFLIPDSATSFLGGELGSCAIGLTVMAVATPLLAWSHDTVLLKARRNTAQGRGQFGGQYCLKAT